MKGIGTKKKLVLFDPESPGMKVVVYRGWFKQIFWPSAFATLGEAMKSVQIDITKSDRFVQHIQQHLEPGEKVICKICGKAIDEV